MTANGILQLVLYMVVLLALAKPLGAYMARVYEGRPLRARPRRSAGSSASSTARPASAPKQEMGWKTYALAMLFFNLLGLLAVYLPPARSRACCPSTRRASAPSRRTPRSTPR